jgi:hypothetical protein
MNIPFILKFINKIELFQILNKLNKQFDVQIRELNEKQSGAIPLWEAEKKILFWTYKNHKHLGSPLRIDSLKSKKSYLIKNLNYSNEGYREALDALKEYNPDKLELNFEEEFYKIMSKVSPGDIKRIFDKTKRIGDGIKRMEFTASEIEKISMRKIFGNLVSRGYATFYPNPKKEISHWEKLNSFSQRAVYENTTATQYNCEGILITQEGMLMGELINNLFKPAEINFDTTRQIYKKYTGAERYLKRKVIKWMMYWFIIAVGWLAFIEIIILIIKEFITMLN